MKAYELKPTNNRKSFYGKATIIEREDGTIELKSYNTIVARIRNGNFEEVALGYTAEMAIDRTNMTAAHVGTKYFPSMGNTVTMVKVCT